MIQIFICIVNIFEVWNNNLIFDLKQSMNIFKIFQTHFDSSKISNLAQ